MTHNLESQKLQYAMEKHLYTLGWREVEVIDDDLGRSAAGTVVRAGFERMVAEVCLGKVGAVAARELSRFGLINRPIFPHFSAVSSIFSCEAIASSLRFRRWMERLLFSLPS
jgi:DNA invertase Pin-like site-specific DNA recombinase